MAETWEEAVKRKREEEKLRQNGGMPKPWVVRNVLDYTAAVPTNVTWLSPLAYIGGVSLVSGPPKCGKSTLVAGLFREREHGGVYLWGDRVPVGPSLLVTEEGGLPVVRKTAGLTKLDIMDRQAFVREPFTSFADLISVLDVWVNTNKTGLIVIDTLAVWGELKDENDAVQATARIVELGVFAQSTESAVTLVHHARKGGGANGESIRGTSAILAAVDHSIEMAYDNETTTDRKVAVRGRMVLARNYPLSFDDLTLTYELDLSRGVAPGSDPWETYLAPLPDASSGDPGLTRTDLRGIWGADPRRTIAKLKAQQRIEERFEKTGKHGSMEARYFRTDPPKLDAATVTESVSEQMKGIFDDQ